MTHNNVADLTEEELNLLKKAGASEAFITVVEYDVVKNDVKRDDGNLVVRNSCLKEVKKYLRGTDYVGRSLTEKKAKAFTPYGGDFFQNLWDGNLFHAWTRADYNNKAILKELFSIRRINADRPDGFQPIEA